MAVEMLTLKSRDEWLERRRSYIGGSDAAAVVGLNPYKTNVELWQEKTGQLQPKDISGEPYVKYGHDAEEPLRELFRLDFPDYQVFYAENNMWINDKYPFAHASLDGWLTDRDGRRGVWECKTTNILQSIQREKWNHKIPDNYYCQVLHYLAITEFDFAILKAQLKYDYDGDVMLTTKHFFIDRAEVEDDINYLMKAERRFADSVKTGKRPNLLLPTI